MVWHEYQPPSPLLRHSPRFREAIWLDRPDSDSYIDHMKTATITQAKNGLSRLIDRVRAGESIVILDRGIPVARLEPITTDREQTGRIRRLERAGLIRAATAPPPIRMLLEAGPELPAGVSAVELLLEERRSGR